MPLLFVEEGKQLPRGQGRASKVAQLAVASVGRAAQDRQTDLNKTQPESTDNKATDGPLQQNRHLIPQLSSTSSLSCDLRLAPAASFFFRWSPLQQQQQLHAPIPLSLGTAAQFQECRCQGKHCRCPELTRAHTAFSNY